MGNTVVSGFHCTSVSLAFERLLSYCHGTKAEDVFLCKTFVHNIFNLTVINVHRAIQCVVNGNCTGTD